MPIEKRDVTVKGGETLAAAWFAEHLRYPASPGAAAPE
jgi:hypothetical protein